MSNKDREGGRQRKGSGISLRPGVSCGSNRYIIKKLEQQLQQGLELYNGLAEQNVSLRAKEAVLLENVSSQSDNLHYIGLTLFQGLCSSVDDDKAAGITHTLLQDVKVAELLELVGSKAQPNEPYTSQCMRRAFTPERAAQVRSMSVQQVVQQLQQLTMKLAITLQTAPQSDSLAEHGAPLLSYTLHSLVDEYTELAMLLHVANDKANLELGLLNLDTMDRREPPAGHWKKVLAQLHLRPDQVKHITAGFQVFTSKTTPLVAETHELVRRMQAIIAHGSNGHSSQPASAANGHNNSSVGTTAAECTSAATAHSPSSSAGASSSMTDASMPCLLHSNQQQPPPALPAAAAAAHKQAAEAATARIAKWSLRSDGDMPDFDSVPDFSGNAAACEQPWQQFGLPSGGLTAEASERLEHMLEQLMHNVWRLREIHRTMTFLWLNTLDKRQKAVSIVASYPFWSQPITMCKHLLEEQQETKQQSTKAGSSAASMGVMHSS